MSAPLSGTARQCLEHAVKLAYLELMHTHDGHLNAEIAGVCQAELIRLTLNRHRGNFSRTAASLGVNRNTLLKLRRKYGLENIMHIGGLGIPSHIETKVPGSVGSNSPEAAASHADTAQEPH